MLDGENSEIFGIFLFFEKVLEYQWRREQRDQLKRRQKSSNQVVHH